MPVWLAVLAGISGMFATWLGIYLAYIRPGRAARRNAEAKEREAVATFMSEQMQQGIRVLIGERGDPEQGLVERYGLGKRMANVEAAIAAIHKMLNGGGLGSQIQEVADKFDQHTATAEHTRVELVAGQEASREEFRAEIREVRIDVADIARAVGISEQRIEEKLVTLDEKVNVTLAEKHQETEMLRSALQASIEAEPTGDE